MFGILPSPDLGVKYKEIYFKYKILLIPLNTNTFFFIVFEIQIHVLSRTVLRYEEY